MDRTPAREPIPLMTQISRRHPRYASLVRRARLAEAARSGLVVPEGLIAQGRAEAFDYLLGERTTPSARTAEKMAARWLHAAQHPVLSVNGNVAALVAREIAALQRSLPSLRVEVNLFHRTPGRARAVAHALEAAGVVGVLGVRPSARIAGLPSDRALVDRQGIYRADVCVIPLEDGDRADALSRMGKRLIAIDLNPLSRTSRAADLPIVDEVGRALAVITREVRALPRSPARGRFDPVDRRWFLTEALRRMARRLPAAAPRSPTGRRASRRPARGSARRSRRRH